MTVPFQAVDHVCTVALKEQASQIQIVRAQLEVSKSAPQDGSQQALRRFCSHGVVRCT
jgi:hypothetical protein